MGFYKKIYSKERIQKIAKTGDVQSFVQYFKADGYTFMDEYSNSVYLQLIQVNKINDSQEKEKAIICLMVECSDSE